MSGGDSDMKKNKAGKVEWWFKKGGRERIEGMALWEIEESFYGELSKQGAQSFGEKRLSFINPWI